MGAGKKMISNSPGGWMFRLLQMKVDDEWVLDIGGNNPVNGRAAIKRLRREHSEYAKMQFQTKTNRYKGTFTITRKEDYDTR